MRALALSAVALLVGCSSSPSADLPTPDTGTDATTDTGPIDETGDETGDETSDAGGPIGPVATPPDPAITCPVTIPADTFAAQRASCTFTAGATTASTLGVGADVGQKLPIRHVIVLMRENRSFDHLLGKLHDLRPDVEAVPSTFTNPDISGASVPFSHATTTCIGNDPNHQWDAMHNCVDDGKMDGFVKSAANTTGTDGHFVMSYYDQTDLPFEYWLASTWPLNDHHFGSVRSGTYPDRLFMLLGTNDGVQQTGLTYPDPTTPTIFDALNKAGFSWGVYSDGSLLSGSMNWDHSHPGSGKLADFMAKLDAGTLPNVSFVDGFDNVSDDHPTADLQVGEAWTQKIYDHAIASPQWQREAIIWTYDEGGGFADHMPPPNKWCVARPGNAKDTPYFELGVRIPLVVVSPWAKPNYVSHVVQEHTSITRFIQVLFGMPAMTSRDANADALLDMFDFSSCTPPMLHPPTRPDAAKGGCK